MHGDIEKVVSEHAITLGVLVSSFSKIEGFMEKTMESQLKQEIILERLANFEENNGNDHKHIHLRMDKLETRVEDNEKIIHAINDGINTSCVIKTKEIDSKDEALKTEVIGIIKEKGDFHLKLLAGVFSIIGVLMYLFYQANLDAVSRSQKNATNIENIQKGIK